MEGLGVLGGGKKERDCASSELEKENGGVGGAGWRRRPLHSARECGEKRTYACRVRTCMQVVAVHVGPHGVRRGGYGEVEGLGG